MATPSTPNNHPYQMTISLSVLNHLGIGLYSNVPAVLSEIIANAWDADAENVFIDIRPDENIIIIADDGCGMTQEDINKKYLNVGYQKREMEPNNGITPRFGREPMGRKGIGKLSVFSIAAVVEIYTVRGDEFHAFEMKSNDIENKIKSGSNETYYPTPVNPTNVSIARGTSIVLKELRKNITTTATHLRRRVARRFSVIGMSNNFSIYINGEEITPRDRDYYRYIEFLWCFGDVSQKYAEACPNTNKVTYFSENLVDDRDKETSYKISGWLGTVDKQEHIDEESNTIAIFAHGKLVHEDLLKDLKEGGVFTKYLIGEIDADFLDDDPKNDIITSARQSVKEDDIRFEILKNNVKKHVKAIGLKWIPWRNDLKADEALRRPYLRTWYETLKGEDRRKQAKKLLGKIESVDYADQETKKEIYKGTLLGFHRLAITDQLSLLETLETEKDFELFSRIFGDIIELERVDYYSIAKVRTAVIEKFQEIVDGDKKERIIQEHLFKALWLLDASWDAAATNSRMEERLTTEFKKAEPRLTQDEIRARLDIRYQDITGKHVIVELKKYSANVEFFDLLRQINKYRSALEKCLETYYPEHHKNMPIEVICIVGSLPYSSATLTPDAIQKQLSPLNARIMTYDELIESALLSYKDYLKANERISKLISMLNDIDKDFEINIKSD